MRKKKKLYEGKTKTLYETEDANYLILEFRDDVAAFNGKKKGRITNKGYVNNQVSGHLLRYLASFYVPTHFVDFHSDTAMVVHRLQMLPLQVVVHNFVTDSLVDKGKLNVGDPLPAPVIEFYQKDPEKGNVPVSEKDAVEQELCSKEELEMIKRMALKINAILKSFFDRRNLKLVEFKLEFGRDKNGKLVLADELSPDSILLWDAQPGEPFDKERFRLDSANPEEVYEEIRRRVFLEDVVTE